MSPERSGEGRARLQDVAVLAGVSIRTVSNVVTGSVPVAPPTRARVEQAIDQLQYRPNLTARRLRSGRSNLIGMLVPELDVPYFSELARRIRDEAAEHGYRLLVEQADGNADAEREFLALRATAGLFDGVIVNPLVASDDDILATARRTPLVVLGEHATSDAVAQVGIDNVTAAHDATRHLIERGRRRLAVVGAQRRVGGDTARARMVGFEQALTEAGLSLDPQHVIDARRFHRDLGAQAGERLLGLPQLPDGVFCFNDQLAVGLMHTLVAAGVRVPDDVAVVGFDNSHEAQYANPGLTSVAPDIAGITEQTMAMLLSMIGGETPEPLRRVLGHAVIVRGSTG